MIAALSRQSDAQRRLRAPPAQPHPRGDAPEPRGAGPQAAAPCSCRRARNSRPGASKTLEEIVAGKAAGRARTELSRAAAAARPPAPRRPLLRRRHRQRGARHPEPPARAPGFESDIFAESVHPRMAHLARPLWEYARGLVAGDGVPLPLLDRQRGRPPDLPRPRPAGRDLPQHHARPLLPRLPSPPGRPLLPRPPRAGRLRAAHGAGPGRQRVQPPGAGGGRVRAHRRAAHRARPGRVPSAALAGDARALRRRPHQHPLRRAASSRTRRSTTSSASFAVYQKAVQPAEPAAPRRRPPRPRALLRPPAGAGARAARGRGRLHRPRRRTTSCWPATRCPTCSCASPSTRASACRCWRRWSSACP